MAVELIAATANASLLGTFPGNATYVNGGVTTNFPPDLILRAQTVGAGYDPVAINTMTALLRKFNSSGVTNNLPNGLVECSPQTGSFPSPSGAKTTLKRISQDPMLQDTCPGVNDSCSAAQVIVFPNSSDPFARAVFTATVNLTSYTNNMPPRVCGVNTGGRDAVWQIPPSVGVTNRQFTVSTAGSNFSTMLSVWKGSCAGNNLTQLTCTNNDIGLEGIQLSFDTDGINTFFIVGEGPLGQYGRLILTVTSP
jgi:hypothetical protein